MIRLGILGLGYIGRVHLSAAQAIGAHVTAVGTRHPEGVALGAAQVFTDYEAFLAQAPADAVIICLPTWLHEPFAVAAAASGRHVLCEKPLALDAEAAARMTAAATAAGVILMAAQVLRFWPQYLRLKELVTAGAIGPIREVNALRIGSYPRWAEWFRRADQSGGALLDLQIHDLDFLYWLLGMPGQIRCTGSGEGADAQDSVHTWWRRAAQLGTAHASYALPPTWPFRAGVRVLGETGAMEYGLQAPANVAGLAAADEKLVLYPQEGAPWTVKVASEDPYQQQLRYFLGCVERRESPTRCPAEDSVEVLRCADACRRSLTEGGQPISLSAHQL